MEAPVWRVIPEGGRIGYSSILRLESRMGWIEIWGGVLGAMVGLLMGAIL